MIRPWRVLASRHVVADRWIRVRADHCQTAEGVDIDPFYVLEYPDWVQIVAISPQQEVLLIRQYRHGVGQTSLELPAGAVDAADPNVLAAAERELLEETGCKGRAGRVVHCSAVNPANHTNRLHTVLITEVEAVQAPAQDPTEVIEVVWTPRDAALAAACSGAIPALQAASLLAGYMTLGWLVAPVIMS